MNWSNESWHQRLQSSGPNRDDALAALREILLSRLRAAFRDRGGVDHSLLDDVIQETLLRILDRLDQFQGASRFTTWATSIAVRIAFTELRQRHWKDVSLDEFLEDLPHAEPPGRESPPTSGLETKSLVDELYRIIHSELTGKQRTALLAELKGMPLEEIGRRMGTNRNAVYKLTHDARKRLKHCLERAGYSAADLQIL
jgi:RNA polymerase sigma-70 factor (ECF subfamily)